ncbi:MAG: hypothetical protein [Microviridae sp.]|nr:MAG: hypothetical protein [Microviridae sp.]
MAGPFAPLVAMGGSMLGTLSDNAQARRNAASANAAAANPIKQPAPGMDLAMLRAQAVKNGFNPLTILGATGGVPYQSSYVGRAVSQPASVLSAGFNAVSGIAQQSMQYNMDAALSAAQFQQQRQLQQESFSLQSALYGRSSYAGTVPNDAPVTGAVRGKDAWGNNVTLSPDQAERLGYGPGFVETPGETEGRKGQVDIIESGVNWVLDGLSSIGSAYTTPRSSKGYALGVVPMFSAPGTVTPVQPSLGFREPNYDAMGSAW